MNKLLLLCGVSILCTACSVGPDYKRPPVYRDEQIAANLNLKPESARHISPDWYKSFNDPDLNRLIAEGLKHSPDIKTALEKMRQARYQLYVDRAGFLPTFDAKGTYDKSNQNLAGSFPIDSEYYQVGIDAAWELDIWGGQRRLTESAAAMLKAAAADFDNVRLSLTAEIASQYINWRLAEKQLMITEQNLKLQQEIFDTVKAKYDAGLADDLAYKQAQSVLDTTKMQLPALRIQEKSYQNALSVLVGKLPSDIIKRSSEILKTSLPFDSRSLYDLPVDVVRNRPDVQAAEQQLIAENALIGHTVANLLPSVSLSGFLGYQNRTLSPIFGPDYNMYSLSGAVNLPLLHWGELVNQVKIQESATREAFALYQASLLTAVADISNAMKGVSEEEIRNRSARSSMEATQEILDLSLQKYQNGLIEFSDVLTAEQNKLTAEQDYLQSNANVYLNVISFYKAVGGGLGFNRNNPACRTDGTNSADEPYKG